MKYRLSNRQSKELHMRGVQLQVAFPIESLEEIDHRQEARRLPALRHTLE